MNSPGREVNFPQNGSVVVIDDQWEEALPLIKSLSKNGIPVTYFTGKRTELPTEPLANIRLVFLDVVMNKRNKVDKGTVSTIGAILKRIVSTENGPYILIAWTRHEELIEEIKQIEGLCKPAVTLSLEKASYVESGFDLSGIGKKLFEVFGRIGVFHLFLYWENTVNEASKRIVNEFSAFHNYTQDEWNSNLSNILYQLAIAQAGKQLGEDKRDTIQNALLAFNRTFYDALENSCRDFNTGKLECEFNKDKEIPKEIRAQINTKLLLDRVTPDRLQPGNVYTIELSEADTCKIEVSEIYNGGEKAFEKVREEMLNQTKYIELEVSPNCDFAQNKWKRNRILPGIMCLQKHAKQIKTADYLCISPAFDIDGNIYNFVFDFRYLTSYDKEKLANVKPIFRIKHELLTDIQTKLAKHINRPGIIYM